MTSPPYEFATKTELSGVSGGDGIYAMADGVTEPEFDAALSDAKTEGNLSPGERGPQIQGVIAECLTRAVLFLVSTATARRPFAGLV